MNEYLLGNFFGLSQIIIGYPFDTIKTNMQNSRSIKPLFQNPTSLYRGIKYPLLTTMIGTTFMFGNYSYFLEKTGNKFISASATGIIGAFLITPFDYLKIHQQVQDNCTRTQIGVPRISRLFRGLSLTIARESISIPAYFLSFDLLYYQWQINPFLAGAVAGVSSWLSTYPLDTLKTRRQLYPDKPFYKLLDMGRLYNGLFITLVRAFLVNGTSFYIYTKIKKEFINNTS
jgi:solute carrier family 25 carnitine/acylcarnitine transporter 20/29